MGKNEDCMTQHAQKYTTASTEQECYGITPEKRKNTATAFLTFYKGDKGNNCSGIQQQEQ